MNKPKKLYKTTIIIWTEYDTTNISLPDIAFEATEGEGYCSYESCEIITDQKDMPDTEFFDDPEGENK